MRIVTDYSTEFLQLILTSVPSCSTLQTFKQATVWIFFPHNLKSFHKEEQIRLQYLQYLQYLQQARKQPSLT